MGELIFYAVLGPGLLVPLVLTVLRTREGLQACGAVFLLLLLLGGFGVGVDLIHSALLDLESMDSWTMSDGPWDKIFGFVEDGGELVILFIICALSCAVRVRLGG